MVPVHEIVMMLYSDGSAPQLTITAGRGYIIVPGFQICFDIFQGFNPIKIEDLNLIEIPGKQSCQYDTLPAGFMSISQGLTNGR